MQKKLRVACLHGYGTNDKFLQRQMRSFRKQFDKDLEFVFLNGSFYAHHGFILDQKVLNMIQGQTRAWTPNSSYKYDQKKFTTELISQFQKLFNNEEYDGMIGFSQGAVMIHTLLKLYQSGQINWKGFKKIKFCILVCGNHWDWDQIQINNKKALDLPSIHLISQSDFLYRKSIYTTTQFKDPLVIHHSFGHSFPRLGRIQFNLIKAYIKKAVKQQNTKDLILNQSRL